MPFVNEEELKNKNKLVKDYINNRKLLKQKLQKEIVAKQQLQKSASEIFRPITKMFEETQKKTDKRQDQLIRHIQQQLAIEDQFILCTLKVLSITKKKNCLHKTILRLILLSL